MEKLITDHPRLTGEAWGSTRWEVICLVLQIKAISHNFKSNLNPSLSTLRSRNYNSNLSHRTQKTSNGTFSGKTSAFTLSNWVWCFLTRESITTLACTTLPGKTLWAFILNAFRRNSRSSTTSSQGRGYTQAKTVISRSITWIRWRNVSSWLKTARWRRSSQMINHLSSSSQSQKQDVKVEAYS